MRNTSLLTVTTLVGTVFLVGHHRRTWTEPVHNIDPVKDCCWAQEIPEIGGVRCMPPGIYRQQMALTEPQKLALGTPININIAHREDLQMIPGIGRKRAQSIVSHRKSIGGFTEIADLEKIPGIGARSLARIAPFLTVNSPLCIRKEP
jgi:competence ComEA-like helix-hairpin-helix protein